MSAMGQKGQAAGLSLFNRICVLIKEYVRADFVYVNIHKQPPSLLTFNAIHVLLFFNSMPRKL